MHFFETAKQIVCNIIAVALSMTVAAVSSLLPNRPDWMERVEELAVKLRAIAGQSQAAPPSEAGAQEQAEGLSETFGEGTIDIDRLLLAYNQLWQFVHDLRSEGLSMDDDFCERIEREWSVTTLLTYVRNADRSLQEQAEKTLETASTFLASRS